MINTSQSQQIDARNFSGLRPLRNDPAIMPTSDYQKLQEHLEQCESAIRPSSTLLSYVLSHKLMSAKPVPNMRCPDLVIGGCRVTYTVDGGAPQTGLLVHRAREGLAGGVIPVASLLGAALLGMKVGQRAPLLNEDGTIGRLMIIDVAHSA